MSLPPAATPIRQCRACQSSDLTMMFSLGSQYLSDFYDEPQRRPARAPLNLVRCGRCTLVQLTHTVDRAAMYHDRYGYRSGVNAAIRDNLLENVKTALGCVLPRQGLRWLDIASNDGTLLGMVPRRFQRIGVDPVMAFAREASMLADVIVPDYFTCGLVAAHPGWVGQVDVVTSVSMFYDVDDLDDFVQAVQQVLAPRGVWVIQQNYLPDMLANASFDNICHEHLTYFSLQALEALLDRHRLEVLRVELSPINGGCIRTVVGHRDARGALRSASVSYQRHLEESMRLTGAAIWGRFAQRVDETLRGLSSLVDDAIAAANTMREDPRLAIYGASTRGAVIWQALGLGPDTVSAAVETQAGKIGRWYSALGVPIISEREARERRPPAMLVGPWWHRELFIGREREYLQAGGLLIFPLPVPHIVGKEALQ